MCMRHTLSPQTRWGDIGSVQQMPAPLSPAFSFSRINIGRNAHDMRSVIANTGDFSHSKLDIMVGAIRAGALGVGADGRCECNRLISTVTRNRSRVHNAVEARA